MQLGTPQASAAESEFRAYWVDAFGEGIYNEAEITKLVAQTKAANLNALVVQVGRRGDCFCNRAMMPRTQANIAPLPFDPLDSLIAKAHTEGIQVHAWIITTAIWNSLTPPLDRKHIFNQHGPSKSGGANWISLRYDGANRAGADYLLDPGHPDAADYMVRMYTSVAANYDIDGLNFDRVRLPDQNLAAFPGVSAWGYNPVAVDRFQQVTGRTDRPRPDDAQWLAWRRDQITSIVRKVYVETYAIKPQLAISADTITYGYGPATQGGWENTRTYGEVLQDWRGWMEEGILDINLPMNYKREHFTTEPNNQLRMYEEWNEFAKDNQYDRQVVIGSAAYLNFITGTVTQVRKALAPSAAGNLAAGWSAYSYRTPDALTNADQTLGPARRVELIRALTQPSEYDPLTPPIFESPVPVPSIPWKDLPTKGHLMGTVTTPNGVPFDQIRVDLYDAETDVLITSRVTDGIGWFGFVDLIPGRYKLKVDLTRAHGRHQTVTVAVSVGKVAAVEMTPFMWDQEGNQPLQTPNGFDSGDSDLFLNGER